MKRLLRLWLAIFGSAGDFLATRKGQEADFWQQSRGSVLQAAKAWPQGLGWWYVAKRFLLRQVVPPVLNFGVTITLLLAAFGGWIATQENRDAEARAEARKQAFEQLEKVKQGANHGER